MSTTSTPTIKTRFLIISDTHGTKPKPNPGTDPSNQDGVGPGDIKASEQEYITFQDPLPEADVVLHCGDLTKHSRLREFKDTFDWLRAVRAPLKLVIAGNHDFALDEEYYYRAWDGKPATVAGVRSIIKEAAADGVYYLDEGTYDFNLQNGARLSIYASQCTPSFGGWAFQYTGSHDFNIPPGVDVAMTHGPPLGVNDFALLGGTNAGCPDLFRAVHRARPKIHCFGHIHEAWGAMLASWNDDNEGPVCFTKSIDLATSQSLTLEHLGMQPTWRLAEQEEDKVHMKMLEATCKPGGISVDLTQGPTKLVNEKQTLFVNAATMTRRYRANQPGWLVDIDLKRTDETSAMDLGQ
ncbi:Metallo-dependent phosphatase-like protein [Thelonectria olida]|uniref:Metallo-dependent phosphatase-like protein n=1 Tax=Thelonectria olida TaxID=1576542 RepID=A0A9P9ARN8_9HYPO|nr:Metallo-dependent phosphatase-like protein [Thelonectria olida]